jgi:hypothetical protein
MRNGDRTEALRGVRCGGMANNMLRNRGPEWLIGI